MALLFWNGLCLPTENPSAKDTLKWRSWQETGDSAAIQEQKMGFSISDYISLCECSDWEPSKEG